MKHFCFLLVLCSLTKQVNSVGLDPCSVTNGATTNTVGIDCQCGTSVCTAGTGMFCQTNTCHTSAFGSAALPNGDGSTSTPGGGLRKVVSDWIGGGDLKKTVITTYGSIEDWDVSGVTNMYAVFYKKETFNGDLSKWNVAAVTSMIATFQSASAFNGDLSKWNVAAVTNLGSTFQSASVFNGDLSKWDVSAVWNMYKTFYNAKAFNFKHALDIEWEAKKMDISTYPGNQMYDLTCSSDSACGNCGKKSTAGSAVTCSSSVQPAKDATTVCTFCADDYNECCTTPTCDNIDGSSTPFAASSCSTGMLKQDLSTVSCATAVCAASDCCFTHCPHGTFHQPTVADYTKCAQCNTGQYQDTENQKSCKNCSYGKWSSIGANICYSLNEPEALRVAYQGAGGCSSR